jgi:hypothetical protein
MYARVSEFTSWINGYVGTTTPPPPPTSCTQNAITVSVTTDNYPAETAWTLKNASGTTVASGNGYTGQVTTYNADACLADGDYTFTITDSYGDGICCSYGNGNYSITDASGNVLASGASFTSSESKTFTLGGGTTPPPSNGPTCADASGISASRRTWKYYTIDVPAGTAWFEVAISGGTGDADLYVRRGSRPTTSAYDCRPYKSGNSETCTFNNPTAGTYHIGVYAYAAFSGLSLQSCYDSEARAGFAQAAELVFVNEATQSTNDIEIFPNPVTDMLNVVLNVEPTAAVKIFSMTGVEMMSVPAQDLNGAINVASLPKGMYIISVNDGKANVTQKFMKK